MSRERWVGIFFFVGIVLLGILAFVVDDEGHVFSRGYTRRYFCFVDAGGQVVKGSMVKMSGTGVQVGRVDGIELIELADQNRYTMKLNFSMADDFRVAVDSEVRLAMTSLFQGMHLEITPGTPGAAELKPNTPESEVRIGETADLMRTVARVGNTLNKLGDGGLGRMMLGAEAMKSIERVMKILATPGGLGKWVMGDEAYTDLQRTVADLTKTVETIRKSGEVKEGTIARLLYDKEMAVRVDSIVTDLSESMKGLRAFTADVSARDGVIARLAGSEEFAKNIEGIVSDVREMTSDLREGKSLVSKLMSDEKLGEDLGRAVSSLADFADNLSKGEGTIARLIGDPELFIEIKRLVSQTREAVEDAREAAPISAFASVLFGAVQ